MKRICQRCNVISQDFNLWCQEKYCPAENATEIFDNGEWFGPIEIIQPIVVTRSAIVYHARREEEVGPVDARARRKQVADEFSRFLEPGRAARRVPVIHAPMIASRHRGREVGSFDLLLGRRGAEADAVRSFRAALPCREGTMPPP